MFTGLVQDVGTLVSLRPAESGQRMCFQSALDMNTVGLGESIAVDGVCLTVIAFEGDTWTGDVSHETLRCTTLGERVPGDPLHMEKALRMGDPLGGHMVQGHVDCVGERTLLKKNGECWDLSFSLPDEQAVFLAPKGSVTIDGVSLTVNWVKDNHFGVTIIPHTAQETHLTSERSNVNIETDILGKYVVGTLKRMLPQKEGVSAALLKEYGFLD